MAINPYSAVPISQQLSGVAPRKSRPDTGSPDLLDLSNASMNPLLNGSITIDSPAPQRTAPAPTNNNGGNTGGNGGGGMTNEWAISQGYTGLDDYYDNQRNNPSGPSPDDINSLYAPTLDTLSNLEANARQYAAEDETLLGERITGQKERVGEEKEQLLGETAESERRFRKTLESALREAVRGFNALDQQRIARFGAGSSAGGAVGELAQQEFFRQQGEVGERGTEGALQFEGERAKIAQFAQNKISDLDTFMNEAMTEIRRGLQDQLSQINARRNDVEANKTRDKLALLENVRNQTQALREQQSAFRKQVAMDYINNVQSVTGKVFTPQEIFATIQQFESSLPGAIGGGTPQGATQPTVGLPQRFLGSQNEDELLNATQIQPTQRV